MRKESMGDMLRTIRREKGITQEKLAEGICAVSTLSKIENGSQVPNRQTFELLMERLGEPGFSYLPFLSEREMQVIRLQQELMEALEYHQEMQVEEKLWVLEQMKDVNNVREIQFCQMIQLLWFQTGGFTGASGLQELIRLFQMTHPDFDGIHTSEDIRLSQVEILILNNVGIAYLREEKLREAMAIFLQLYRICEEHTQGQKHYYKQKAGLCGNIAVCARLLEMYEEAEYYCDKGLAQMNKAGNLEICLRLLHTRSMVARDQGDMNAFFQDMYAAKKIYEILYRCQDTAWNQEEYLSWRGENHII